MSPAKLAIVLPCDGRGQVLSLDGTKPGLPFKAGRCQTMTPDDKRNATASLPATLNTADARITGTCINSGFAF